jgi:choline dehydrogenase
LENPAHWGLVQKTAVDWQYRSVPQRFLVDPATGTTPRATDEPRGRLPGGSSNLYIMMHIRGHYSDFDNWAYNGCPGWRYQDVLPYFRRIEDYEDDTNATGGKAGPLRVASARLHGPNPMSAVFFHACRELGFPSTEDFNGPQMEGVGWHHANVKDGRRHDMFSAYLEPALLRPNLNLQTAATVTRLLIDETRRCIGVEYNQTGSVVRVACNREVILCAGAIESPKILLLSGIGPSEQLNAFAIPVISELPGVGENFHNHVLTPMIYKVTHKLLPPRFNLSEVALFCRSDRGCMGPDLQLAFVHKVPQAPDGTADQIVFLPGVVRPMSRGSIRLSSADPLAHPCIDPNYLAVEADLDRLTYAARLADRIASTRAFAPWIASREWPPPICVSDSQFRDWVRSAADSYHHQAGSCKMGMDRLAVVDPQLRVYGIRGLRVADASIMPAVPSGNCHTAVVMIAEKAAELIKTAAAADRHLATIPAVSALDSASTEAVRQSSKAPAGFNHVALTCRDPIAVERFYSRYFGFRRARVVPLPDHKQIVFIKSGEMYLELFAADTAAPIPTPTGDGQHYPGVRHIAFKVDNLDNALETMGEEIRKRFTLGPLDFSAIIPHWRTVWLADPEGNIVEISQGFVDQESPPSLIA